MTNANLRAQNLSRTIKEVRSILLLALTVLFGVLISPEAAEYVKVGFDLAAGYVIPSSFPFMLISDIYVAYGNPESIEWLNKLFSSILGIPKKAIAPFICGNVGGFPIGAKMISESYASGELEKSDAERLIAICNNPSCAFVVGGVGLGIYGDASIGFMLLISLYVSTLVCTIFTQTNCTESIISYDNNRQKYSFVSSVKRSGSSCINIFAFICAFSVMMGLIKKRVKYAPLLYTVMAFAEVTNAVKSFAFLHQSNTLLSLSLSAFSLGFGGVCVGMQSAVFTSSSGLKMKKYYLLKTLEGVICAAIISLLYTIKNNSGAM